MRAWVLAVAAVGCSGKTEQTSPVPSPSPIPTVAEPAPVVQPDFPEGTRSLELRRTIGVRLEPGDDAKRIGTIGIDTRVSWVRTAKARGCDKVWVEIRPRGWICSEFVVPSVKLPSGREVPVLERGELVPGVYGKVTAPFSVTYVLEKPDKKAEKKKRRERERELRADARRDLRRPDSKAKNAKPDPKTDARNPVVETRDRRPLVAPPDEPAPPVAPAPPKLIEGRPLVGSVNVRQYDELAVGGRQYWRIDKKENEYVLKQAITQHRPSLFGGVRLGDDTGLSVPIAFSWSRWGGPLVTTTVKPLGGGIYRQIPAKTPLHPLETMTDKTGKPVAYRLGPYEWIGAGDIRVFHPVPAPPMLAPGERWIDIDIDNQILVAYEGELPVYATLVSSGSTATPTETGVYRMWLKESEADMKGLNGEDPYSVATVPWTQFFSPEKGLALHTAYWHDGFGTRRSHGCVNLAPRDARWLYFWSDPQVPPGWTMAAGVAEAPGSIVRIRTKDDPAPEAKGYAKKVLEARLQNAPAR